MFYAHFSRRLPRGYGIDIFDVRLSSTVQTRLRNVLNSSICFQEDGRVLASHGDGTFTVEYSSGKAEEDVPKRCIRAAAGVRLGTGNRRSPSRENGKRM